MYTLLLLLLQQVLSQLSLSLLLQQLIGAVCDLAQHVTFIAYIAHISKRDAGIDYSYS